MSDAAGPKLRPTLCSPARRLAGVTKNQWIDSINWHEAQAERAMQSLSCGSENSEFREANRVADHHWHAAALMRMVVERMK